MSTAKKVKVTHSNTEAETDLKEVNELESNELWYSCSASALITHFLLQPKVPHQHTNLTRTLQTYLIPNA